MKAKHTVIEAVLLPLAAVVAPTAIGVTFNAFAQEEHHGHEQHRHLQFAKINNPVPMTADP